MEQTAYFGGGCFWCTEAIFDTLTGVKGVQSGYMGGYTENPTYEEVCSGRTGHAELVKISYDDTLISYEDLLLIFFKTHDPSSLNRQGNDVGTQYRSVIFYVDEMQKQMAQSCIQALTQAEVFAAPIVTTLEPLSTFYAAEAMHDDYFMRNPNQGYCAFVIQPKLNKFAEQFRSKIRPELFGRD